MIFCQDGRFSVFPVMGLDPGGSIGEKPNLHLDAGFTHSVNDGERPLIRVLQGPQFVAFKPDMCYLVEVCWLVYGRFPMP